MKEMLIVGCGGFVGAVLRHRISGWVMHHSRSTGFPLGTFSVNVIGCLVAGVLSALIVKHGAFSAHVRLLIFTGILGGFTTFSAFGVDAVYLLERHEFLHAGLYVLATLLVGLGGLWLGLSMIR